MIGYSPELLRIEDKIRNMNPAPDTLVCTPDTFRSALTAAVEYDLNLVLQGNPNKIHYSTAWDPKKALVVTRPGNRKISEVYVFNQDHSGSQKVRAVEALELR